MVDRGLEADQHVLDQVQLYLMYEAAFFDSHFEMAVKSRVFEHLTCHSGDG